jgi:hypothetical protein
VNLQKITMELQLDIEEWNRTPEAVRNFTATILKEFSTLSQVITSERQAHARLLCNLLKILPETNKRNQIPNKEPNRQVVLVSDRPSTRLAKIAYGLTQAGLEVILLYRDELDFNFDFFSAQYQYSSPAEAVLLASLFSPITFHVFSSGNFDTAIQLINAKVGKITFDNYDQFGGMILPIQEQQVHIQKMIQQEKYCLENADAICNRALSLQIAKKQLKYQTSKHQIFFPEYCWDKAFRLTPKLTDGIHVVFAGNFSAKDFYSNPSIGIFDKAFIESLTSRGIHYHLYPPKSPNEDEYQREYKDYIQLSNTNKFFHFHRFVPPEELLTEISQYHIGISSRSKHAINYGDVFYNTNAMKYFCANKAFDYLDAGLEIIFGGAQLMEWLLKRSAGCRALWSDDIGPHLAQKDITHFTNESCTKRISDGRKKLSISSQIPRLISFYESL